MQQKLMTFNLIPININNELGKLNQAILNPDLYNRLRGGKNEPVYLRVK
jgi:hypothetical protein